MAVSASAVMGAICDHGFRAKNASCRLMRGHIRALDLVIGLLAQCTINRICTWRRSHAAPCPCCCHTWILSVTVCRQCHAEFTSSASQNSARATLCRRVQEEDGSPVREAICARRVAMRRRSRVQRHSALRESVALAARLRVCVLCPLRREQQYWLFAGARAASVEVGVCRASYSVSAGLGPAARTPTSEMPPSGSSARAAPPCVRHRVIGCASYFFSLGRTVLPRTSRCTNFFPWRR